MVYCGAECNWVCESSMQTCCLNTHTQCVQRVVVCCSVLQFVSVFAVCCSVLQCVAVCCKVLQCVAVKTRHRVQKAIAKRKNPRDTCATCCNAL